MISDYAEYISFSFVRFNQPDGRHGGVDHRERIRVRGAVMVPATNHPDVDLQQKVKSQSRIIIDLLRLVRTLRDEYAGLSLIANVALENSHAQHHEFERTKERYYALLDQRRAAVTARKEAA